MAHRRIIAADIRTVILRGHLRKYRERSRDVPGAFEKWVATLGPVRVVFYLMPCNIYVKTVMYVVRR